MLAREGAFRLASPMLHFCKLPSSVRGGQASKRLRELLQRQSERGNMGRVRPSQFGLWCQGRLCSTATVHCRHRGPCVDHMLLCNGCAQILGLVFPLECFAQARYEVVSRLNHWPCVEKPWGPQDRQLLLTRKRHAGWKTERDFWAKRGLPA